MTKTFVQMLGFATTLSLLPAFSYAQGTLYKWTDSRGHIYYTNTPTTTAATAVDNTLPPASKFDSPIPPPEAEKVAPFSSESKPNPEGKEGTAPGETTGADDSQSPPPGEIAGGEPVPIPTDGSVTDGQQETDAQRRLTPEQEQALKDSPM